MMPIDASTAMPPMVSLCAVSCRSTVPSLRNTSRRLSSSPVKSAFSASVVARRDPADVTKLVLFMVTGRPGTPCRRAHDTERAPTASKMCCLYAVETRTVDWAVMTQDEPKT
uniref:Uncharacterized protein n=1 Tax=Neobodo designis TaxID=312471 RepID=A0A6U4X5C7_NEODS